MSNNKTLLAAEARAKAGKGAARAIRRESRVPAVVYGDKKEPVLISILEKDLVKAKSNKAFFTQLCEITVGNDKHLVLPREIQLNPVTDRPEHADFLRVSAKTEINVSVPLRTTNEKASPGLVRGGMLNFVHHEVEVQCDANNIPSEIVIDLTGLDVGSSIQVEDLKLPAGATAVLPGNATIITLVAPSALKSEDDAKATEAAAAPAEDDKAKK